MLTAVVSLAFIGSAIATSAAHATQDAATPAPLGAASCTVDPIDPTTYNAAIQKATPPLPQPVVATGKPADQATVDAVTDTIKQSIACTNIGDLGRLLAVIDPSYAPTLLGVPYADVPAAVVAAAKTSQASNATPLVDDVDHQGLVSSLIGVTNVVVLDDGQVAAVAAISRQGFPVSVATIYLRNDPDQGRYIITNYSFHPATATPAA
jgi:hypothetical protein